MAVLGEMTWAEIDALRARVVGTSATAEEAAQRFTGLFVDEFPSIVLARLFIVLPFEELPAAEQSIARACVQGDPRLGPRTPVLSLLGTRGREPAWNDRTLSRGHRAIPLLDREFVRGAPMIAKLLADLEVDLAGLDDRGPILTRRLLGGRNCAFYVPDVETVRDAEGRHIIPDRAFVEKHHLRTAFGMGGAYVDGTLAVAILMTTEALERLVIDRFPSFIINFKMATAELVAAKRIYADEDAG